MLTALLGSKALKAAWPIVRDLLPPLLMLAAIFACVYGAKLWHTTQVENAAALAQAAAEAKCAAAAAQAEVAARRKVAEAERKAIEEQAKASADYEAKIDELLTNYRSLRERHARLARSNPPHPDCRVPSDRLRILREAIRGPEA